MHNQPDWLQIDEYLYPSTLMNKVIHISSSLSAHPIELSASLIYNSYNRSIDIADTLTNIISQFFNPQNLYQIYLNDAENQKQFSIGFYPFKQSVFLEGSHIQAELISIRVQEVDENGNLLQAKHKKGQKTVKEILQRVAEWRKIHIQSNRKVTLQQSASMLGICKNTLQDYFIQIKMAQKFHYNFEGNFNEPFKNLRKFVKQNNEKKESKPNPVKDMLQKYQPK